MSLVSVCVNAKEVASIADEPAGRGDTGRFREINARFRELGSLSTRHGLQSPQGVMVAPGQCHRQAKKFTPGRANRANVYLKLG